MNIGLDLDGVLHPWHEGVWKKLTNEGYITSTFDEYWDKEWEVMREEKPTLFMNMVNDPLMYSSQAPYYGVRSFLKCLEQAGHKIWYVTQRPAHLKYTTESWIRHWRFPFQENLIVTDNSKKMAVITNEIDLFVDDAARHAQALDNYTKVILVKRPYNKDIREDFECVDTVLEIGKYINGKE